MAFTRRQLYVNPELYFSENGSGTMKLTPEAALEVCRRATLESLVIVMIEGGIWHAPGFEARMDCIWDGVIPPIDIAVAGENNLKAEAFIKDEMDRHGAFIISTALISGFSWK